jgi:Holliday junction resolvasome RuvABC endonuclease subunit
MTVFAIDPGPTSSGMVAFDPEAGRVIWANGEMPNAEVMEKIRAAVGYEHHLLACESIEAMYAHVGKETVRTIRFTGRIEEAGERIGKPVCMLSPQEVKKSVCGTASAKDPAVRQALIDRLGEPGTKKAPGATYGVSKHAWRALAVAVAAADLLTAGEG